ncbi:MAG: hypothetical protein DLM55_08250 [Acidimicrobiales bacterium]|nr:MAG: hypothetical protein DLM55_08250 [Acidimicrobiales bacterium]
MLDALLVAVGAGMLAAVNPCGFAMLPAYLSLVVSDQQGSRARSVGRALAAGAVMTAGFMVVFGVFGLVVAPIAASVQSYLPAITVLIGLVLIAMGGLLLAGRQFTLLLPKPIRGAPNRRIASMFGYGIAYAVASLSCTIGPFLAVSVTVLRSGKVVEGIAAFVVYAVGMGLVVTVLALGALLTSNVVASRARRLLPYVSRIGGGLLLAVGAYVAYYGWYELRLYHGGGSAADPVIDAAGVAQGKLVEFVDWVGPGPFVVALGLLAAIGVFWQHCHARVRR